MAVLIPTSANLTPAEAAMVSAFNDGIGGADTRDALLNALGRERRFGYLADGEIAESARLKLIAAWEGR